MADQTQDSSGKTQRAADAEKGPSEQKRVEQEYQEENRQPESPGGARGTGTDA